MLFQHTFEKVILGQKTQTRRLVKPRQYARRDDDLPRPVAPIIQVAQADKDGFTGAFARVVYNVGSVYSVQPGRGKPGLWWRASADGVEVYDGTTITLLYPEARRAGDRRPNLSKDWLRSNGFQPARIRLKAIRREDVRTISEADVKAEGFSSTAQFLDTWATMHDKEVARDIGRAFYGNPNPCSVEEARTIILGFLERRPAERYAAWSLTFELLKK